MDFIQLLPYGPSLHYPFVDKYPQGPNQNREGIKVGSL